jgi:hypothetical protein
LPEDVRFLSSSFLRIGKKSKPKLPKLGNIIGFLSFGKLRPPPQRVYPQGEGKEVVVPGRISHELNSLY